MPRHWVKSSLQRRLVQLSSPSAQLQLQRRQQQQMLLAGGSLVKWMAPHHWRWLIPTALCLGPSLVALQRRLLASLSLLKVRHLMLQQQQLLLLLLLLQQQRQQQPHSPPVRQCLPSPAAPVT